MSRKGTYLCYCILHFIYYGPTLIKICYFTTNINLREYVNNYRHPDPRRVWREGLSGTQWHHFRWIGWIRGRVPNYGFVYAKRYFLYWRHRNSYIACSKNIGSILGRKKAPAGILGGAPSMFLCLEDIKRAYFMSLRHKTQDSVFQKNKGVFLAEKSPCGHGTSSTKLVKYTYFYVCNIQMYIFAIYKCVYLQHIEVYL